MGHDGYGAGRHNVRRLMRVQTEDRVAPQLRRPLLDDADADAPRVARIEEVTDDLTTTVVRAGGYVVSLARVIGTPLGEGERLVATLGEDPTQHVLATVQRG